MNKRNTTITTIELTEKDKTSIVALQRHLEALNPAYKVPKRAVISWALQKAVEEIERSVVS